MAATATQIHQLYIAYFGRVADPAGLAYWTQSGADVAAIASAFGDSKQAETAAQYEIVKYPATIQYADKREAFIDEVYTNLFGRAADADGKAYWSNELATGKVSVSQFLLAVVNGAQGDDASIIANKVAVSASFASQMAAATGAQLPAASLADGTPVFVSTLHDVLNGVNANVASVQIGIANAAGVVSSASGETAGVINLDTLLASGRVYDAAAITSTNGSAGNDVFAYAGATLATDAKIDAGAGTDTLNLSAALNATTGKQFYNFEAVKLSGAAATAFDASVLTNSKISSVVVDKAVTTAAVSVDSGTTVGVEKALAGNLALTVGNTKTDVSGDSVVVHTDGTNGHTVSLVNATAGHDVSNLLLNNTGVDSAFSLGAFQTVTLTGDHAANLGTVNGATQVLAASTYTGDVTVTTAAALTSLSTGAGNDAVVVAASLNNVSVSTGAGNDHVTLTGGNNVIVVDAGDGNDLITVSTLAANTGSIKLSGGAGADAFSFNVGSTGSHVTIADFAVGDSLIVADATAGIAKAAAFATAPADFAAALLTVQTAVNAAGANHAQWFQFGGDTYVVGSGAVNTADSAGLADDLVIKLAGTVDLTNAIHAA
ncbi:DUF4214 domain-containing protein [Microvirgula curvata]